ncbi:hypothetical protein FHX69_7141 [Prauserella muralis]|nr:hypothetical protein FHX69_7141 [Prauserella muralis]SDU62909.1 hypothetical protein SAMN04489733_7300 [Amycolatopsis keratiniphila]
MFPRSRNVKLAPTVTSRGRCCTIELTLAVNDPGNENALVLNAGVYGDNYLLVLLNQKAKNFKEGGIVTATGTVENISATSSSAKNTGLVQAAIYDAYTHEQFLHNANVRAADDTVPR